MKLIVQIFLLLILFVTVDLKWIYTFYKDAIFFLQFVVAAKV